MFACLGSLGPPKRLDVGSPSRSTGKSDGVLHRMFIISIIRLSL